MVVGSMEANNKASNFEKEGNLLFLNNNISRLGKRDTVRIFQQGIVGCSNLKSLV